MKKKWSVILTEELKDRKLSQKELSTLIGVSPFTLNRWINDHNNPSPAWKKQLRKILKTKIALCQ